MAAPHPTFGQLLRHHRLRCGLSQERLAEAASLSVNQISDLERDQRARPHPDTLRRLADALALDERDRATFIALARSGRPAKLAPSRPMLPLPLTRFFARPGDLAAVRQRLASARLLTLTGAGGVGKTRLAQETAHAVAPDYPDGVWLIDLADVRDEGLVPPVVARALGLAEQQAHSASGTVVAALRERRVLLLVDNCEHLLDACAQLFDPLLRYCPEVRILATSRERLRIDGEHVWPVQPLAVPAPDQSLAAEAAATYPAIQLFVDRAENVLPTFSLTDDNAATIARICRLLDGIPLALQLAAAHVTTLPLGELAERLADRFRLLTEGSRAAPARHQTLLATIDWGDGLLAHDERTLLRRLALFAGGWTVAAAEEVVAGEGLTPEAVLPLLTRLTNKSLIQVERSGERMRHRLLEMIRQHSADHLAASGETPRWQQRHADYFLALAEEAAPELTSTEQTDWLIRLEDEHDNLRAALRYLIAQRPGDRALHLATALQQFWQIRGYLREGRSWLEQALALPLEVSAAARASALGGLGEIAWKQGDYIVARSALETALAQFKAVGDQRGIASILKNLGTLAHHQDPPDYERAEALFAEYLALCRTLDSPRSIASSLNDFGLVALEVGDYSRAEEYFTEALAQARTLKAERLVTTVLVNLGVLGLAHGNDELAQARFVECLGRVILPEDSVVSAYALAGLAGVACHDGRAERAAQLIGASESICAKVGYVMPDAHRARFDSNTACARTALGPKAWAVAWAHGYELATEQAVALALPDQ